MFNKVATKLAASTFALSLAAAPVVAAEYGKWDTDGNAGINESEFRSGFEANKAFDNWDTDKSGTLTQSELETGIGDNEEAFNERCGDGWFGEWDANTDSALSEDEYYDGLYTSYDADNDNVIEEPEFGDLGDDMGDGGWFDV